MSKLIALTYVGGAGGMPPVQKQTSTIGFVQQLDFGDRKAKIQQGTLKPLGRTNAVVEPELEKSMQEKSH